MSPLAIITIGIDPTIEIGPLTLAWHGITIAIGIMIGGLAAGYIARERGLDTEPLYTIGSLLAIGGLVGGKIFYAIERGDLSSLVSTKGFTFNGGVILAAILIAGYVRREHLDRAYLDIVAVGLPLGVAIGRIGDVINGEHYGEQSDFALAVRNTHPDAGTPDPELAYHSGGLYEVILATIIFAIVWPLRHRMRHPTLLMWLVLALFAVGRFFEFFLRSDSVETTLGLSSAQWTSVVLLVVAAVGAVLAVRAGRAAASRESPAR